MILNLELTWTCTASQTTQRVTTKKATHRTVFMLAGSFKRMIYFGICFSVVVPAISAFLLLLSPLIKETVPDQ